MGGKGEGRLPLFTPCKLHEERGIVWVYLLRHPNPTFFMQNQRGFVSAAVLIAIILGIIVLGGGAYFVMHQSPSQITSDNFDNVQTLPTNNNQTQQTQATTNTPAQTTTSQNQNNVPVATQTTSNLKTYSNSQYGFSAQYDPSHFDSTPVNSFMGKPNYTNTLLSLFYKDTKNPPGFDSASITFRASGAVNYEDCMKASTAHKQATIGGRTFYKDSTGDAATGHFSSTDSYRTYFNGACYEIHVTMNTYRTDDGVNRGPSDFSSIQNALQSVLNSFHLTVSETAPIVHAQSTPQWKTYTGTKVPVSFSYPGNLVIFELDSEIDINPGAQIGLDTVASGDLTPRISVQKGYLSANQSAATAMQSAMKTEPIAYPSYSYTSTTIGGESASIAGDINKTSVIYVLRGQKYFRIVFFGPFLTNQYQTFLNTFAFTN